jgi:hypothetical protein
MRKSLRRWSFPEVVQRFTHFFAMVLPISEYPSTLATQNKKPKPHSLFNVD